MVNIKSDLGRNISDSTANSASINGINEKINSFIVKKNEFELDLSRNDEEIKQLKDKSVDLLIQNIEINKDLEYLKKDTGENKNILSALNKTKPQEENQK